MESCQPIRRLKDKKKKKRKNKKKKACLRGIACEGTWFESGLVILILE
jgi:hypothetical protein